MAFVATAVLFSANSAQADILAEYDFAGGSAVASTVDQDVTAGDYTLSLGTISSSTSTHFINAPLLTETLQQISEITITPTLGTLNLTSLDFGFRTDNYDGASGGDPADMSEVVIRSSVDNFVTDIFSFTRDGDTFSDTGTSDLSVSLADASFQGINSPITFRWFASNNTNVTGNGAERTRITPNVTLNGDVIGGTPDPGALELTVDRDTGELTISNTGDLPVNWVGYEITTGAGGLNSANWASIDATYDASGDMSLSTDEWTTLSNPTDDQDLSEFDFESAAGATLAGGASVSLGVGAWTPNPRENLDLDYVLPDGTEVDAPVNYVGNAGEAFAEGDFDADGDIDAADWAIVRDNLTTDHGDASRVQAYLLGDMNNDRITDASDFVAFRTAFEAANPGASFAQMVAAAAVPEPTSWTLLLFAGMIALMISPRKRLALSTAGKIAPALLVVALVSGGTEASAQVEDFESFTVGTAFTGGAVTGSAPGTELTSWTFFDFGDATTPVTNDTVWEIQDESAAADGLGSKALVQSSDAPDFLRGFNNNPIGGAMAYSNQFDTSSDIMVYEYDFRMGGNGIESGNFLDMAFYFGVVDEVNNHSLRIVSGQSNGTSRQLQIANTVGDFVDNGTPTGEPNRSNLFDRFSTGGGYTTGLPQNSQLRATVTHDAIAGSVDVTIVDLSTDTQIDSASVTNEVFQGTSGGDVGIGVNNDAISVSRINVFELPRLTLQIDPVDGDMQIVNTSGQSIDGVDLYEINGTAGNLDAAAWSSLQDQNLASFPAGDGSGNGWEEGGASSDDQLIEAFLTGSSDFADSVQVYLGEAADDGVSSDVSWRYHIAGAGNNFVNGKVEFVNVDAPVGLVGDFNNDGTVDAADYTVWRDNLGQSDSVLNGNGDGDGTVDADDYTLWSGNYGASSSSSSSAASAVPEPGSLGICLLGGIAMFVRRRTRRVLPVVAAVAMVAATATPAQAIELDRDLQLGDNPSESAVVGETVTQSFDSSDYFVDFGFGTGAVGGNPVYANVSSRPGATADSSNIGITFDGTGDYLNQRNFNNPETSAGATGNTLGITDTDLNDYTGLRNRGMQIWVNPSSAGMGTRQSVLHDSNQFGILISDSNTWILQSNGTEFDTGAPVVFDNWSHVSVVREFGVGTVMLVNGLGIGRTGSTYDTGDTSDLVIGANTGGDELTFSGGTQDFFNGTLDQLEVFTWGETSNDPAIDYGDYNFGRDNGYARTVGGITGVAGDINSDGVLNQSDVDDFVAGWRFESSLGFLDDNDSAAGFADLTTFANGDLDFDGDVDLSDAFAMHSALIAAGSPASLNFEALAAAVPEPSSAILLGLSMIALGAHRRQS